MLRSSLTRLVRTLVIGQSGKLSKVSKENYWISRKFGMAPNAEWTMFGQIAAVPEDGPQASPFEMYFSNEIEGALEKIFEAMRGINALLSVSYPEIAITPIAIYRE
jgi:hypothetical protein